MMDRGGECNNKIQTNVKNPEENRKLCPTKLKDITNII